MLEAWETLDRLFEPPSWDVSARHRGIADGGGDDRRSGYLSLSAQRVPRNARRRPMPWKNESGFLAPGAVQPAAAALLGLVDDRLPVTQYVGELSDWWRVAGPALVARAAQTLRSTLLLHEQRCDLDAATLTRTLVEQLLTFAFLAHAPDERLMAYESADLLQSEKIVQGVSRLGYELPDREEWATHHLGARPKPLKMRVDELADHADREWAAAAALFFTNAERPYRVLYETVYRTASRAVHSSAYATGPFVDLSRSPTVVVRAAERSTSLIGYEWAVWTFAIMLVIAGSSVSWPAQEEVVAAMAPYVPD